MGIERTLADRKGRDFCELPKETITHSSKSRKNRRRQKKMSMPPVQKLYETCKDVFASGGPGIVPPPQDIERIRFVLGTRFTFLFFDVSDCVLCCVCLLCDVIGVKILMWKEHRCVWFSCFKLILRFNIRFITSYFKFNLMGCLVMQSINPLKYIIIFAILVDYV